MGIYTRRGDRGWTGLLREGRVRKDHQRIACLGAVDELNASLGAARAFTGSPRRRAWLETIQRDLFAVGSHLAGGVPRPGEPLGPHLGSRVRAFEAEIDRIQATLPRLSSFVLPGNCRGSAFLHVARAAARRAERCVVGRARAVRPDPAVVVYLNRLADLLFVLARDEDRSAGPGDRRVRIRPAPRTSRLRVRPGRPGAGRTPRPSGNARKAGS